MGTSPQLGSAASGSRRARLARAGLVTLVLLAGTAAARAAGYRLGAHTVVRCRKGHLFTTIWIPGVSVTSLRLGWWRLQRCPVGGHWSLVSPVRESTLTADQRRFASEHSDVRLP
jgi:hypothetical protein